MGFIAELCENIELNRFNVTFNPNQKRVCTANADGVQMIYCKGNIHIHNILFENQFDDPINIHGTYIKVHKIINGNEIIGQLVHHQHKGVLVGKEGDSIRLVDSDTMVSKGVFTLEKLKRLNKGFIYLKFDKDLLDVKEGFTLENISYIPEVLIENCIFRNNRARGLLLTSNGKIRVKNNLFQIPGAAIFISGDCKDWFESGSTEDIVIENNIFDNCSYIKSWGKAPIQIEPSAKEILLNEYYHKSIIISENEFNCFDDRLIFAYNVEKLVFKDNIIKMTNKYKEQSEKRYTLSHIGKFEEINNKF